MKKLAMLILVLVFGVTGWVESPNALNIIEDNYIEADPGGGVPHSSYSDGRDVIESSASAVPEPSTLLLIGTGLLVIAGLGRRMSASSKREEEQSNSRRNSP